MIFATEHTEITEDFMLWPRVQPNPLHPFGGMNTR